MPVATHGGFDLAVEIDQAFATSLAQLTLPLQEVTVPLAPEPQDPADNPRTGTAAITPRLRHVWFNVEPGYVGAAEPTRVRAGTDSVSIVLELNGAIQARENIGTGSGAKRLRRPVATLSRVPVEFLADGPGRRVRPVRRRAC